MGVTPTNSMRMLSVFAKVALAAAAFSEVILAASTPASTEGCTGADCQTEVVTVSVTSAKPAPTAVSGPKKPAEKKPGDFVNSPVVPIQICTFKGQRCLNKASTEFVNTVLEFDDIATFVLTAEGVLYRLDDGKCAQAVKQPAGV